jgi:hypothetical protein
MIQRTGGTVATLLVLLLTGVLWAQTGTSNIRGTVTDTQGRVVVGAAVTITNQATNATRNVTTNETGGYSFDLITPGEYRLEVENTGFKKQSVSKVHALVGKPTEINVQLEVGAANEIVEVQASSQAFLANTQDASLGNNFVTEQITQLPLEGRNLGDLLSLQPGATKEGYVTGARADQANVTLDGVDINNAQSANAELPGDTNNLVIGGLGNDRTDITQGPVLRLNTEAIEEFRVTTANGNANQGRSSGSQVNLVTKSGSNAIHGSAFEFYRTKGFTANDWFNNHAGVGREDLIRHTFGGTIGGPIIKDKAFFFYSYESRHESRSSGVTRVVPLASMGDGSLNYTYDDGSGNIVNDSLDATQVQEVYSEAGINPTALQVFADAAAKYPANDTSQGDQLNTGGFRFNAPTPTRLNSHVAKFDFNLTNRQTVFARLNVIYDHQSLVRWLPGTKSPEVWNHPWGIAVGHTWMMGNNWVNNFRYGLTRQAFTEGGDSDGNDIGFRFVYYATDWLHPISRVTPVHNFTDDLSWNKGKHSIQFGVNVRKISNSRVSFANAFDNAITNPSWYAGGGESVSDTFQSYLTANGLPGGDEDAGQSLASVAEIQNAATALIGRLSQYSAIFSFGRDGSPSNVGKPTTRNFATQAYDTYVQDAWKVRPNLTLTLGLRYSLERPVYETQGFEVQPDMPLGTFFANRLAAAAKGQNYLEPVVINLSGPANHGKPMYNWDKNNFQPRIAVAWSPAGANGKSVLRGGFAITNDYYGQALAVDFDLNNTLGFTSSSNINANTYDIFDGTLAPAFTAFGQDVRSLPNIDIPGALVFPLSQFSDFGERIEQSIDSNLHAPKQYVWNFTFERQMPKGLLLSASYIGRQARGLLARRDVAAFNDIRDPQSGVDWYTAGTMLEKQRQLGTDTSAITPIPFFENLLPSDFVTLINNDLGFGADPAWSNTQAFYAFQSRTPSNPLAFFSGNDWTDTEALVDQVLAFEERPTLFMHPQYGALSAWSTIANSNYHAFTFSARERLSSLTLDFNYTFSHSLDDSSGLQTAGAYGSAFITNPIRQGSSYANSDFDVRHTVNASALWQLPFGKGRSFLSGASPALDAVIGGWQLSSIFRWNTGLPVSAPYDDARWATNWNVQSNVTPTGPVRTCPSRNVGSGESPKLFGTCDTTKVYQSFRNAYPGETGPRNTYRLPSYVVVDFGLGKTWNMPWSEGHQLTLRWEVFNATNTQSFGNIDTSRTGYGVGRDPALRGLTAPDNWSNFIQIQGSPRSMQVGLRYAF